MSPADHPLIRRFIEDAGNATQSLGVGRAIGQIYAYLYFSEQPQSLDAIKDALGISKGSASMCVRQLEQWGAVQRVWVRGDRKDYYGANDYFGRILRSFILDVMGKRIDSFARLLDAADLDLNGKGRNGGGRANAFEGAAARDKFLRQRVQRLREFQRKAQGLWNSPLVKMILK